MNEERLAAARVASLFGNARPAYVASVALSGLLLLVLWDAFPAAALLGWFSAILLLTGARMGLQRFYERNPQACAPRRWETLFALGAGGAGLLWTVPPAAFLTGAEPLLQIAVIFVVGGSIIGASGVYAASPTAYYAFSTLPLLAISLQLLTQGHDYAPGFSSLLFTLEKVPGIFDEAFRTHRFLIPRSPECLICGGAKTPGDLDRALDDALARLSQS